MRGGSEDAPSRGLGRDQQAFRAGHRWGFQSLLWAHLPTYVICWVSPLATGHSPGPGQGKAPPDTSDRPPTFQNRSAETDPDVILIVKPNPAHCPHCCKTPPPFPTFPP